MGRPPKSPQKKKRLQYAVWVSAEEKSVIDKLIESSNLSASQFFLTQVIEKPIQRPKKKTLPNAVVKHIMNLEKLSGLLALSILKTKDKAMIAEDWQRSSRAVKWITHLVVLRIFEDFDFPKLKSSLLRIKTDSALLYWHLDLYMKGSEREEVLMLAGKLNHQSEDLLASFEKHYQAQNGDFYMNETWTEGFDIHSEIQRIKNELLKL